ncbi:transcriptional regulator [Stetteria hydrogenophila]
MQLLVEVLRVFSELGAAGPGDVAAASRLPRYKVLAVVKCLEELGLVEPLYARGSYKVYRVSVAGERLLELAAEGVTLRDIVESAVLTHAKTPSASGEAAGEEAAAGTGG